MAIDDPFWDSFADETFARGPFSDFFKSAAADPGRKFYMPKMPRAEATGEPSPWLQTTVGGFCAYVAAQGYRLQLEGDHTGNGVRISYSWRSPRGQLLAGGYGGIRGPRAFARICQALADWEPDLRHWRRAFVEVLPETKEAQP